jgi:2-(3-amino-3-carboxypropyl)histidine synthase
MEEDRAQVDLGVAMDVEDNIEEAAAQRQPKKRFVGRKQAAEVAARNGTSTTSGESGTIQGMHPLL